MHRQRHTLEHRSHAGPKRDPDGLKLLRGPAVLGRLGAVAVNARQWAVNRPEWGIAFFATAHLGGVSVPLDVRHRLGKM